MWHGDGEIEMASEICSRDLTYLRVPYVRTSTSGRPSRPSRILVSSARLSLAAWSLEFIHSVRSYSCLPVMPGARART